MWALQSLYSSVFGSKAPSESEDRPKSEGACLIVVEESVKTWNEIVCPEPVKETLQKIAQQHTNYGNERPIVHIFSWPKDGILLYGPSGCGKHCLAQAVAAELHYKLLTVDSKQILNLFEKQEEHCLRNLFDQVRQNTPCVFAIKDVDKLSGASTPDRVLNQFLTELDGIRAKAEILVIGTTSSPWNIDGTFLRPGRLFNLVFVPLLDDQRRVELYNMCLKSQVLEDDVDTELLAKMSQGMTGAQIEAKCKAAIRLATNQPGDDFPKSAIIGRKNLEEAFYSTTFRCCGNADDYHKYELFHERHTPSWTSFEFSYASKCDSNDKQHCFHEDDEDDLYS